MQTGNTTTTTTSSRSPGEAGMMTGLFRDRESAVRAY